MLKNNKIKIYINNCLECVDCHSSRHYTSDSFEMAFDYTCQNKKLKVERIIEEYVSWNEQIGEIPSWCPRRK